MNLLVISAVICGALYGIIADARDTSDANGNYIGDARNKVDMLNTLFNPTYQRNGNNRLSKNGYRGNLATSYGTNTWLVPNRTPISNGYQFLSLPNKNNLDLNLNGNYGQHLLWNRPANSRPTYLVGTGNLEDVDPEVANRFPELVDLLNRLKELNKLKEEGKLPFGANKPGNGQNNKPDNENTNHNNNETTKIPNDKDYDKPKDNGNTISTVTVISDGKVYFQAQPVVPENEKKEVKETVYYVKS